MLLYNPNIVFFCFSEADARIQDDVSHPRLLQLLQPLNKKISDLLHHIIVLRILLHRLWISLCMHQNISCIRFRTEIGKARFRSQSTHIVDDMGSSFQRLPGYLEFGCIHREKEFWKLSNPPSSTGITRCSSSSSLTGSA